MHDVSVRYFITLQYLVLYSCDDRHAYLKMDVEIDSYIDFFIVYNSKCGMYACAQITQSLLIMPYLYCYCRTRNTCHCSKTTGVLDLGKIKAQQREIPVRRSSSSSSAAQSRRNIDVSWWCQYYCCTNNYEMSV